jgi:Fe2+ or Zn2+ uptake regulation protein
MEDKMRTISTNAPQTGLVEIQEKIINLEKKKEDIKSNLKEKMLKHIARNSKDYIRNTILSLIRRYEKISGFKLKEIIVEEQGLCSKSSFYRILEELEKEKGIDVVKEGKEKVFFAKIHTTSNTR